MRLHRFFIDKDVAFQAAKMRFDPSCIVGSNHVQGGVSQVAMPTRTHGQGSCVTAKTVSQSPLYNRGDIISIPSEALQHQISNVFRLNKEDSVILTDGSGFDYVTQIVSMEPAGIAFHVADVVSRPFSPRLEVTLYAGMPKGDTFEWIVEKATELGVARIVPVAAERSMKKDVRFERLEKISIEAAEQSGRAVAVSIGQVMSVIEAISEIRVQEFFTHVIVLDPTAHETLRDVVRGIAFDGGVGGGNTESNGTHDDAAVVGTVSKVALFVGPEGGWSPTEIEHFSSAGFIKAKLGQTILRAETACCAGLSMLLA